jgi:DNA mismatch repair protein MutS
VRRAGACRRRYLQKLIAQGFPRRRLRTDGRPGGSQEARLQIGGAARRVRLVTPGTLTEEKLLDPRQQLPDGAGADQGWAKRSTGWPGSTSRPARSRWRKPAGSGCWPILPGSSPARADPGRQCVARSESGRWSTSSAGWLSPVPACFSTARRPKDRLARFFGVSSLDGFGSFSGPNWRQRRRRSPMSRRPSSERPPLGRPERESRRADVHRPGDAGNLELCARCRARGRAACSQGHRPHRDRRRAALLAEWLMAPLTDGRDPAARPCLLPRQSEIARGPAAGAQGRGRTCRGRCRGWRSTAAARAISAPSAPGWRPPGDVPRCSETRNGRDAGGNRRGACLRAVPGEIGAGWRALDDELPLMKRDGGFRAGGYTPPNSTSCARCATKSRKVIAGLQADYAEETGVRSLKIKHNNVLGYFIEVTALNAGPLTATRPRPSSSTARPWPTPCGSPRPNCRIWKPGSPMPGDRALAIELGLSTWLLRRHRSMPTQSRRRRRALSVIDVDGSLAELAQEQGLLPPRVDDSLAFEITGGRHPVVEQALKAGGAAVRRQ